MSALLRYFVYILCYRGMRLFASLVAVRLCAADCSIEMMNPMPLIPKDGRMCPRQVAIPGPVDQSCCSRYVANRQNDVDREATNLKCRAACQYDKHNFPANNPECIFQDYFVENGRAKVEFDPDEFLCYSNWVYGYTEPPKLAGYAFHENVLTPQDCQAICQEDEECAHFMWNAPVGQQRASDDYRCYLKNEAQIQGALAEEFRNSPQVKDERFCKVNQGYECRNGGHCSPDLFAPRKVTCIYESHRHVSGPKFCEVNFSSPEYSTDYFCFK